MHNYFEIELKKLLEIIEITHSHELPRGTETLPQERSKRAMLIRSLLRQAGKKAIGLTPHNDHPVLFYGDILMQIHSAYSQAINKSEISGDMAIKGLYSYVALIIDDYAQGKGIEKFRSNAPEKVIEILGNGATNRELGQFLALQNLEIILLEAISCADYDYGERSEHLLKAPELLIEVVKEEVQPLPIFGDAINA